MQVRLAYAGSTGMTISWNTYSQLTNPAVKYGLSSSLNLTSPVGVSITYPSSSTYNNHAKITGLLPDTLYYYQPQPTNLTAPFTFRTSRLPGDTTAFSVALVVDMGVMGFGGLSTTVGTGAASPLSPIDNNTIQSLRDQPGFDFLWHPGDIAYADYWLKEEIQGYLPNTTIAAVSSQKPYMVGPGNHEANCDNGGGHDPKHNITYTVDICVPGQTNFTGYRNHFRMPSNESGGVGNFWYSWDHGMAHFIQLDTETDLGHGIIAPDEPGGVDEEHSGPFGGYMNAQIDWLARDLATVNRSKTPWVVVAGHRPWYVSTPNDSSSICWDCKNAFEPLFLQYSVDLVLSGHVHVYQRNDPLNNSVADPNGLNNPRSPWYITNGAGGHYDGLDALQVPLQSFAKVAINDTYGWSRLTFHNCSHLTHEFVASRNGSVIDSATLFKDHGCTSASIPSKKSSATALVAGVGLTVVGFAVTVVFGMPILL
ncbi:hypothetical protein BS47DRAFT_1372161 [Hydnum rufescens UP504]|uniref:Purple acid phosphatase n=1 Tax=Hydnum rufescens UP504 TaxID=1448309 RepID=A0A9P6B134_9AGAM|nr:hypothetical protein BS47DRAFT_1372161 [Hydnum rufescens UP504]